MTFLASQVGERDREPLVLAVRRQVLGLVRQPGRRRAWAGVDPVSMDDLAQVGAEGDRLREDLDADVRLLRGLRSSAKTTGPMPPAPSGLPESWGSARAGPRLRNTGPRPPRTSAGASRPGGRRSRRRYLTTSVEGWVVTSVEAPFGQPEEDVAEGRGVPFPFDRDPVRAVKLVGELRVLGRRRELQVDLEAVLPLPDPIGLGDLDGGVDAP